MNPSLAALLFWISVAVCAVAELAIVAATARASRRPAMLSDLPADVPRIEDARPLPAPRRSLELLYAAVPAVALAVLFVVTWRALNSPR